MYRGNHSVEEIMINRICTKCKIYEFFSFGFCRK